MENNALRAELERLRKRSQLQQKQFSEWNSFYVWLQSLPVVMGGGVDNAGNSSIALEEKLELLQVLFVPSPNVVCSPHDMHGSLTPLPCGTAPQKSIDFQNSELQRARDHFVSDLEVPAVCPHMLVHRYPCV